MAYPKTDIGTNVGNQGYIDRTQKQELKQISQIINGKLTDSLENKLSLSYSRGAIEDSSKLLLASEIRKLKEIERNTHSKLVELGINLQTTLQEKETIHQISIEQHINDSKVEEGSKSPTVFTSTTAPNILPAKSYILEGPPIMAVSKLSL